MKFAEFRTKHGLSWGDLSKMTGKDLSVIREMERTNIVDEETARFIKAIDIFIDRIKTEQQVFTVNDAFHAAKAHRASLTG